MPPITHSCTSHSCIENFNEVSSNITVNTKEPTEENKEKINPAYHKDKIFC
jgi:hypothetical protein